MPHAPPGACSLRLGKMRIKPAADDLLEWVAIRMNLVPLPCADALFGMTAGRVLGAAQCLGVFGSLLRAPASAAALAEELHLQLQGTRLLCENLAGLRVLEQDGEKFTLNRRMRKWLDPASDTYVGTWIEHSATYWQWYGDLERIVRDGGSFEIHREPAEDEEYWRVYITGQYELARLSAAEVAKAVRLGREPSTLLDVAGAHGWFSAELCRRHEALNATVVDLPGSARVGRAIIDRAGMSDRVAHREGDMFSSDLGGPYDGCSAGCARCSSPAAPSRSSTCSAVTPGASAPPRHPWGCSSTSPPPPTCTRRPSWPSTCETPASTRPSAPGSAASPTRTSIRRRWPEARTGEGLLPPRMRSV
ncbi:MAG: hypothetical protein E6G62_05130 [Actinobacteria bacterium]|nr:MAG: hypothetical protein E6G62_05130 [Actinomycetota bacterium]